MSSSRQEYKAAFEVLESAYRVAIKSELVVDGIAKAARESAAAAGAGYWVDSPIGADANKTQEKRALESVRSESLAEGSRFLSAVKEKTGLLDEALQDKASGLLDEWLKAKQAESRIGGGRRDGQSRAEFTR